MDEELPLGGGYVCGRGVVRRSDVKATSRSSPEGPFSEWPTIRTEAPKGTIKTGVVSIPCGGHPMRCILILSLVLITKTTPALAQAAPAESPLSQAVLTEIRTLRQDLRNAAATTQRVEILMFRLQMQAALADKAEQRLELARNQCKAAQDQQKFVGTQIEQLRKQNANDAADQ